MLQAVALWLVSRTLLAIRRHWAHRSQPSCGTQTKASANTTSSFEIAFARRQACGVLGVALQVVRPTLSMAPVKLAEEWRVLPH
jgi:hypothetical protein